MIDPSSRAPDPLLSRRIRLMVALDPDATALSFCGLTFPWSFYSDAIADLDTLLAANPAARRVGIVLRNRPGPLAALVAALGTGREVVTLSPHLGDIGLQQDIIDLAPDVVVAEDEDWARDAVLVSAKEVVQLPTNAIGEASPHLAREAERSVRLPEAEEQSTDRGLRLEEREPPDDRELLTKVALHLEP